MSKDFCEICELILSGECTELNAYLYHADDAAVKIPVQRKDLASWIIVNKEFLLSVLKK